MIIFFIGLQETVQTVFIEGLMILINFIYDFIFNFFFPLNFLNNLLFLRLFYYFLRRFFFQNFLRFWLGFFFRNRFFVAFLNINIFFKILLHVENFINRTHLLIHQFILFRTFFLQKINFLY